MAKLKHMLGQEAKSEELSFKASRALRTRDRPGITVLRFGTALEQFVKRSTSIELVSNLNKHNSFLRLMTI